jgi:MoxR-like ATPase
MRFVRGPIFANVILADEINRTPPKTQAALLEAMQEHQVTAGGKQHRLQQPFFVLATQNPIEQEGTYPLPEAQLDRFLMKIYVGYPDEDAERKIYRMPSTGGMTNGREPERVLGGEEMLSLQKIVHKVPVSEFIVSYVSALVRSTRAAEEKCPQFVKDWVLWGVGPRGGQALIAVAKARAALDGRPEVDIADIKALAKPVLRHRIVLNYNAEAQGQTPETVIQKLIDNIPIHAEAPASHGRIESVLKA